MAMTLAGVIFLCLLPATDSARMQKVDDADQQVQSSEGVFLSCSDLCYHQVRSGISKDGDSGLQCHYGTFKTVGHALFNPFSAVKETAGTLWDGMRLTNPFGGVGTLLFFCNIACAPGFANDGTCEELSTDELQDLDIEPIQGPNINDLVIELPEPLEDLDTPQSRSPVRKEKDAQEIQQGAVLVTADGEAVVVKMLLHDGLVVQPLESNSTDGKLVTTDEVTPLPTDDPRVVAQKAKKDALILDCQKMGRPGDGDGETCYDVVKGETDTKNRRNRADRCCLEFAAKYMEEKKVGFMSAYCLKLCVGKT